MSAFGTKRTSQHAQPMSAFGGKADIGASCSRTTRGRRIAAKYRQATGATSLVRENRAWARVRRAGWLFVLPRSQPPMQITSNLMAKGRGAYCKGYCHFADKPHVDWQKIDRVESAVLLCLIGGGLTLCVFGAAAYDIGRAFSVW